MPLEQYAIERPQFRERIMVHKNKRRVDIGPHVSLFFEDWLTIQYQIQEMLRAERIFEPTAIEEELNAYNPLIPNGNNWKATMMIQYTQVEQRKKALRDLVGIEHQMWVKIGNADKIYAIADEDLERSTQDKTSAVHFLRFELPTALRAQAKSHSPIAMGCDHPAYQYETNPILERTQIALAEDLTLQTEVTPRKFK